MPRKAAASEDAEDRGTGGVEMHGRGNDIFRLRNHAPPLLLRPCVSPIILR